MTGFIQRAREAIANRVEQFRNRTFMEATMSASALVAMADGEVKISELNKIGQALEVVHELKIYDPHEAVDHYRDMIEELKSDPKAAREQILREVGKLKGDPHGAELLIKVCVAIGKSDDVVTETEREAIGALCDAMNLPRETAEL